MVSDGKMDLSISGCSPSHRRAQARQIVVGWRMPCLCVGCGEGVVVEGGGRSQAKFYTGFPKVLKLRYNFIFIKNV